MCMAKRLALAGLVAVAGAPAHADQCATMMTKTTTMCLSSIYSRTPANKYTIVFGPGNSLSGTGASANDQGITLQGTYTCQGNNFYTTTYAVSDGEQNTWIARFPNTVAGSGSLGIYFTGKLKSGACP